MTIFNSYVSLPEGTNVQICPFGGYDGYEKPLIDWHSCGNVTGKTCWENGKIKVWAASKKTEENGHAL